MIIFYLKRSNDMYQFNKKILTAGLLLALGAASTTNALAVQPVTTSAFAERLQNVPNSTTDGSDLIQGDEWTFTGFRGQQVHIRVDTRDDFGNNTSGLDPVLVLKDANDNVIAEGDDEFACSVPTVCGFNCPEIVATLPRSGRFTIVARDFNSATDTGEQCNGGSYHLTLESASTLPISSLSRAPTVDNGIVGDPVGLQAQLESRKGQPSPEQ
jgi:hypothetical protein